MQDNSNSELNDIVNDLRIQVDRNTSTPEIMNDEFIVIPPHMTRVGILDSTKMLNTKESVPRHKADYVKDKLTQKKEFEIMPKWLDKVGHNCPEMTENMTQFTKDIAGGLISQFSHFQSIFKKHQHDTKMPGRMRCKKIDENDIHFKDRAEQINDLHFCTDQCYPSIAQSKEEIELDNFSKQIISTLN